jgi:hypothetical protein
MRIRWVADMDHTSMGVRGYVHCYVAGKLVGGAVRYSDSRTWEAYVGWDGPTKVGFTRRCEAKRWVECEAGKVEA